MSRKQLEQLVGFWRRRMFTRDALLIVAVALAAAAAAIAWSRVGLSTPVGVAMFLVVLLGWLAAVRQSRLDLVQFTRHLNRVFPELEESSGLWLRSPEKLTVVERLQRQRVDRAAQILQRAAAGAPFATPPRDLLRIPLLCLAMALTLFVAALIWRSLAFTSADEITSPAAVTQQEVNSAAPPPAAITVPKIVRAEMLIAPPRYTGQPQRVVPGLNAEVEERSTVTWTLVLDQPLTQPRLVFGERDTLPLQREDDSLRATRVVAETALYHPTAVLRDGAAWNPAELYSLKVIKDQPPALKILQPNLPRTVIDPATAKPGVNVEVEATDDYGITDAYLIATVAMGTGEAVKFREQQIAFDSADAGGNGGSARRFTKMLDLAALGLEPGDELYFHVVARDNREPENNHSRSETRFIVLAGPEQEVSTPGTGVSGVNLVPQYFRSQRQIIIDTEKLVAERATLPDQEFQRRSNDLGIDQQLLRQRYGQFLGQDEHYEGDGHDHSGDSDAGPLTTEEIASRFGHQHDSQDEATFFQGETKASMRHALAAMWEAEGLLRTNRPAEALVPENRALEILKALQQSDRAYVQRVGFEASPLNIAERRLRGDASEAPERIIAEAVTPPTDEAAAAIREMLRSFRSRVARPLPAPELETARRVESALTTAATNDPQRFLQGLQLIRRMTAEEPINPHEVVKLEQALLQLLPPAMAQPGSSEETSPGLAERYFQSLGNGQ